MAGRIRQTFDKVWRTFFAFIFFGFLLFVAMYAVGALLSWLFNDDGANKSVLCLSPDHSAQAQSSWAPRWKYDGGGAWKSTKDAVFVAPPGTECTVLSVRRADSP